MSFTNNVNIQNEKPSRHNGGGRSLHRQSASMNALPAHMTINASAASNAQIDGALKSPRSQLLDRIRTTPRTSNFVPGGNNVASKHLTVPDSNRLAAVSEQNAARDASGSAEAAGGRRHQRSISQQSRRPSSTASSNASGGSANAHQHRRSNSRAATAVTSDHAEQLAALEQQKQQLIMQNMILAQQQLVMRQMQDGGLGVTPPYTPTASPNHTHNATFGSGAYGDAGLYPTAAQLFFDTNSGQYIQALYDENNMPHYSAAHPDDVAAFQQQQQRMYMQSLQTPQQQDKSHQRHRSSGLMTPDSIDRSLSQQSNSVLQKQQRADATASPVESERPPRRTQTPPSKEGQPARQPKGPPTIDVLMDAVNAQKQLDDVIKQSEQVESADHQQQQLLALPGDTFAGLGLDQASMLRAQQALLLQQIDASPNFAMRKRQRAKKTLEATLARRTTPSPAPGNVAGIARDVEKLHIGLPAALSA